MFVVDRVKPGVISLDSGRFTISLGSLWLCPTRGSSLLKRVYKGFRRPNISATTQDFSGLYTHVAGEEKKS